MKKKLSLLVLASMVICSLGAAPAGAEPRNKDELSRFPSSAEISRMLLSEREQAVLRYGVTTEEEAKDCADYIKNPPPGDYNDSIKPYPQCSVTVITKKEYEAVKAKVDRNPLSSLFDVGSFSSSFSS